MTSRRRWWILALVALVLILAGTGIAGWLLFRAYAPLMAREQIEAALTRAMGRPVRVERVFLHAWLREIVLEKVTVAAGPTWSGEPFLHLERVETTLGISSLWRREVVLSRILLDGLTLRLTGEGGESASASLLVPNQFTAGPVTIGLDTIEVRHGHIIYRKPAEQRTLEIRDLDATVNLASSAVDLNSRASSVIYDVPGNTDVATEVQGAARILADRVQVRQFAGKWRGSSIQLAGEVRDVLTAPDVSLRVKGELNLTQLARRVGSAWPVSGVATVDGEIRGRLEALEISGGVTIPTLAAAGVTARGVAIRVRFAGNHLRLDDIRAQVFGGQLQGSLSVPFDRPTAMETAFTLANASIESLLALAPASPPVRGAVTLEAELKGDPAKLEALQGRARLEASRVGLPDALSRIGLGSVEAEATFGRGGLEVHRATGRWRDIQADLNGTLSPQGPMAIHLTLGGDLATVTSLLGQKGVSGEVKLAAEATGRWDNPEIVGRLQAPIVELNGVQVRDIQVPFRYSDWTLQLDSTGLTLGQSRISTSGSLTLRGKTLGAFNSIGEDLRFQLAIRAPAARFEDLAIWLPPAWRGSGGFSLTGSVEGTPAAWQAAGLVEARALTVAKGISVQGVRAAFSLDPDRITIGQLTAQIEGVPIVGDGRYEWSGTGNAKADVGPVDLAMIPGVPSRAALQGQGRAHLEMTMRPGDVHGSGRIAIQGISALGFPVGDGTVLLELQGQDLRASLAFPQVGLTGTAAAPFDPEGAAEVRLVVKDLAVEPLMRQAFPQSASTISGTVSAVASAKVPFRDPSSAQITFDLDPVRLSAAGEDWENRGPVTVRWEQGTLFVDRVQLASRLGNLTGSGRLNPSGNIDLQASGSFPLELLPTLWAGAKEAGGRLEISAKVNGTMNAPRVIGDGSIKGGRLVLADYPDVLRDVEARFLLSSSGLRLVEATGTLGRGQLRASGDLALDGWNVGAYQFAVNGQDVTISPVERLVTTWNLSLKLVGSGPRALVNGEASLVRGSYTGKLSLLSLLLSRRTGKPAAPAVAIPLNILLKLENDLVINTDLARLRARGTLRLEGTTADPIVFGTLEAHEGQIQFRKNRLALRSATARFIDPRRIDPVLDVLAEGRIRSYQVTVELHGRSNELDVQLSSTPPLSREDLLALVTFGVTGPELSRSGAGLFLGEAANLLAQDFLGLDVGGIGPEVLEVQKSESGARTLEVGKRLTDRTMVTYSQGLGGAGDRKIRVEYELVGSLLVAGEQNFQGGYGADLIFRFRFR